MTIQEISEEFFRLANERGYDSEVTTDYLYGFPSRVRFRLTYNRQREEYLVSEDMLHITVDPMLIVEEVFRTLVNRLRNQLPGQWPEETPLRYNHNWDSYYLINNNYVPPSHREAKKRARELLAETDDGQHLLNHGWIEIPSKQSRNKKYVIHRTDAFSKPVLVFVAKEKKRFFRTTIEDWIFDDQLCIVSDSVPKDDLLNSLIILARSKEDEIIKTGIPQRTSKQGWRFSDVVSRIEMAREVAIQRGNW